MLNLFQSIFSGTGKAERYPKTLVDGAIERAVDGTDPWLRGLSGYRKKLRPAVIAAIDHVVTLVDDMSPPRTVSRASYGHDPLLQAMFLSSEQMRKILQGPLAAQTIEGGAYALLVAELELRRITGVGLVGETLVRDVAQVTAGFVSHRLIDPTGDETETRRLLKRRAFDHLLSMALRRMVAAKKIRKGLDDRYTLLQAKLETLQRGNWGFDADSAEKPVNILTLETQLAEIEEQLLRVGRDDQSLEVALGLLVDVLGHPEQHLWQSREPLVVDRMGITHSGPSDDATELLLEKLHNAEGRSVVTTLVRIELGGLYSSGSRGISNVK
jgi:hypothetical protein